MKSLENKEFHDAARPKPRQAGSNTAKIRLTLPQQDVAACERAIRSLRMHERGTCEKMDLSTTEHGLHR